jgi:hypothetical protein
MTGLTGSPLLAVGEARAMTGPPLLAVGEPVR